MLQEYLKALFLIIMAEMGDKTQILAMAFATRFKVKSVLLGIFAGSFLNHGLAVILGAYLSKFIPVNTIQIIAGFSFIGFALWTLRAEEDDEEENTRENFGPMVTVAIAFFVGELGDKTQLTAITLSSDANYPLFILLGTVSGMVISGALEYLLEASLAAGYLSLR
jgi:putative Ca2+/H+ antiporter (TMEM165/GDT1 family)